MSQSSTTPVVRIHYAVRPVPDAWVLPEIKVPESRPHDLTNDRVRDLLKAWVRREKRNAIVTRNLALRWLPEHPRVGIDPDVCLIEPAPPDETKLMSLCLWKPGHVAPPLAIEIVSKNHPYKDYVGIQDRYAACGVDELWVLDPEMVGPKAHGGPVAIQIWRRDPGGAYERVYHGKGPAHSSILRAFVHMIDRRVFISDDEAGEHRWRTDLEEATSEARRAEAERQRAEEERQRAEEERQRAEEEKRRTDERNADLERRMAELEAKLGSR